jgi:hypothetical protein
MAATLHWSHIVALALGLVAGGFLGFLTAAMLAVSQRADVWAEFVDWYEREGRWSQ